MLKEVWFDLKCATLQFFVCCFFYHVLLCLHVAFVLERGREGCDGTGTSHWWFVTIKGVTVCVGVGVCRGDGGVGHVMSCGLISSHSAQMACDYAWLSRDYSAAEVERETWRVKINIVLVKKKVRTKWNKKYETCGAREIERGAMMQSIKLTSQTQTPSLEQKKTRNHHIISTEFFFFFLPNCRRAAAEGISSDFIWCITIRRVRCAGGWAGWQTAMVCVHVYLSIWCFRWECGIGQRGMHTHTRTFITRVMWHDGSHIGELSTRAAWKMVNAPLSYVV